MTMPENVNENLEAAVKLVLECTAKTKVRGNLELQLALDTIQNVGQSQGLLPGQITALLDQAASGKLVQTVSSRLIRCFIPRVHVPERAVVKAISWMCTNQPSTTIQSLLVRWILLIYDYIDTRNQIHNLYGIIFYFLENQTLFPNVCHLLYLLTRKEDVKMFRVRKLLFLQNKYGPQPYITGLLSLYKLYYPNLVSVPVSATRKIFFRSYDRKWAEIIKTVHEHVLAEQGLSISVIEPNLSKTGEKRLYTGTSSLTRSKRRRLVPNVHSESLDEQSPDAMLLMIDHVKIPFVRINSFKEMLTQIDRIEFPSQIAAALKDPILQHVVAYSADQIVAMRFSYWLQHTLIEEFFELPRGNKPEKEKFLELLINFTDFLQEGIPVVDMFLQRYLLTWNGADYRQHIFRLLCRSRIYTFGVLNDLILEPLRKLYFCSSVYFKCQVLVTLTEMIRNYTAFEWPRHRDYIQARKDQQPSFMSIFPASTGQLKPLKTVQELITFTDKLAAVGLQLENQHLLLTSCVLDYMQLLSSICIQYKSPIVSLPPTSMFGSLFMNSSVYVLARLCGIMCSYKESFEFLISKAQAAKQDEDEQLEEIGRDLSLDLDLVYKNSAEKISVFNPLLLDICNGLWRNRAFEAKGSVLFDFHPSDFDVYMNRPSEKFSIFLHQAFLGFSLAFLRETQPPEKRVHPAQIKSVKDVFLQFLEREHITQIPMFIQTFIRKTTKTPAIPQE